MYPNDPTPPTSSELWSDAPPLPGRNGHALQQKLKPYLLENEQGPHPKISKVYINFKYILNSLEDKVPN